MRSSTTTALAIALTLALAVPGIALAAKGGVPGPPDGTPPGQAKKADTLPAASAQDTTSTPQPEGKVRAAERRAERDASREASGTKITGLENAHDRIAANIAKSQAKVAAGKKKAIPKGLLGVSAKFSEWLGLGSGDSTETPDPGDSGDTSGTVEPTSTVDPADTTP